MSLVQACLCAGKALYHRFNLGGGAVKHMDASSLTSRDDRESSLHCCGCPGMLVQACLCAEKT